jgi:hypothetical protein
MDRSTAFTLVTASSVMFVTIISFIVLNNIALSPVSASSETLCNTLSYSHQNAINLVFISSQEQAQVYSQALLNYDPLNDNRDSFNIYYIDEQPQCELYQSKALFCHSRSLTRLADSCPNDYIFVLEEVPPNIRSSSYLNVLSINTNHQHSVMAHEFGHAFANLAEEYTPASLPKGTENCALSCSDFKGLDDSCSQGCSTSAHFRSINDGVMRTLLSDEFGRFNERLISDRLPKINVETISDSSPITGNVISEDNNQDTTCKKEFYHLITASLDSGNIKILDKKIEQGCVGSNGGQLFSYKIKDSQNSIIETDAFNPELIFTDLQSEDRLTGQTIDFTGVFYLKVQSIAGSQTLEIYDTGNKLLASESLEKIHTNRPCKIN